MGQKWQACCDGSGIQVQQRLPRVQHRSFERIYEKKIIEQTLFGSFCACHRLQDARTLLMKSSWQAQSWNFCRLLPPAGLANPHGGETTIKRFGPPVACSLAILAAFHRPLALLHSKTAPSSSALYGSLRAHLAIEGGAHCMANFHIVANFQSLQCKDNSLASNGHKRVFNQTYPSLRAFFARTQPFSQSQYQDYPSFCSSIESSLPCQDK